MNVLNQMQLEFPSRSANEAFARTAVACFAAQMDPTVEELNDIKTAVSEAVTNCIVHAYPDKIGKITLQGPNFRGRRSGPFHPRPGLRHRRYYPGAAADVHDRRRRAQRHGLYDHGELYDCHPCHLQPREGDVRLSQAKNCPPREPG